MTRLAGRVAIVTGGAQGLGGATARRLAEEGARVLIADIDVETAQANVERIRSAGNTAEALKTDVGKHDDIRAMVEAAVKRWGRLDILVNNAFEVLSAGSGDAVEVPEEVWDHGMAVLVKSIYLGAKYDSLVNGSRHNDKTRRPGSYRNGRCAGARWGHGAAAGRRKRQGAHRRHRRGNRSYRMLG